MKVPHPEVHRIEIKLAFLFLLGLLFGAILMMLYTSHELNRVYTDIVTLKNDNRTLTEKLQLKDRELRSWNIRNRINDIFIHVNNSPSDIIKAEIMHRASEDTQYLIGKEIKTIENTFESLYKIFSPKIYMIDAKAYEVSLQHIVIGSKTHLYLRIKVQD